MRKITKVTTVLLAMLAFLLLSTDVTHAAKGWVSSDTSWYYYDAAGNKTLGWSLINGHWYYFSKTSGIMQTGNVTDNGHLYYLKSDGKMATGTVRHPEGTYTYDASGALNTTKGWHEVNGYWYYFINSNTVFTSGKTPDGYYVNEYGQWLEGAINKGIDVSRYQGDINWTSVKNSGISFAMVRIGSVKYGVDAKFATNMTGANRAGLKVGAYVYSYATTVEAAIEEANFAIKNLSKYTVSFPVAIDIESTAQKSLSPSQLAAIANAFCSTLEAAGYYPIVYSSKSWFAERIDTPAIKYDLWVAQYYSECTYSRYNMWQASSTGRVNGIEGNVDINYVYKDYFNLIQKNGWVEKNGIWHYYKNYKSLTGLQTIDNVTYYFDAQGRMHTDWVFLNNKWYCFDEDGAMVTGWFLDDDKWYYLNNNGVMQTGWLTIPSGTYYLNASGEMLTGWQNIGGKDYYFLESGARLAGCTVVLGGVSYSFDTSGCLIQ